MVKFKYLHKQFERVLNVSHSYVSERDKVWNFYASLSGFYNGKYFAIVMKDYKGDKTIREIEICHTTDNPESLMKELKK